MNNKIFKKTMSIATAAVIGLISVTSAAATTSSAAYSAAQSPSENYTIVSTEIAAELQCSPSAVNVKAGKRQNIRLVYNDYIYDGDFPEFSVEDESVAKAINSDCPDEFYVQGLKEGSTVITIKALREGNEATVKLPVTVEAADTDEPDIDLSKTGIHVLIDSLPDKQTYNIGEELELDGGKYSVYFNGGGDSLETIYSETSMTDDVYIDIDTSAFDNTKPGIYPITITYNHYTGYWGYARFDVQVVDTAQTTADTADIPDETTTTVLTTTTELPTITTFSTNNSVIKTTTVSTSTYGNNNLYTTTTAVGAAIMCSENEINIKAGQRWHAALYFGNGEPFDGAMAEFQVHDPSIAVVQTSDVPHEFYVIGISEGQTSITIIDPINKYRTELYVNVTGETPEDFGSGMKITVDSMPTKLEYALYEDIDLTGGTFSIEYVDADNQTIKMVDNLSMTDSISSFYINTSAFDRSLKAGTYPIIISANSPIYGCWDVYVFYVTISDPSNTSDIATTTTTSITTYTALTTTTSNGIMCQVNEIELKAGECKSVGLYSTNGNMFEGVLPDLSTDNVGVAIARNSDTPWNFYVVGISEGETVITIKDPRNNAETKLNVKVTGETPENMGSKNMHMTIDSMPTKLNYTVGEELDLTGGAFSVEYYYSNNDIYKMVDNLSMTDEISTSYIYTSAFDSSNPGTYPIIIYVNRYDGSWSAHVFYVTVSESVKGDIDGDGKIGIEDASLILKIYAQNASGIDTLANNNTATDINGDGKTDIADATCVLNYYAYNAAGLSFTWEDIIN